MLNDEELECLQGALRLGEGESLVIAADEGQLENWRSIARFGYVCASDGVGGELVVTGVTQDGARACREELNARELLRRDTTTRMMSVLTLLTTLVTSIFSMAKTLLDGGDDIVGYVGSVAVLVAAIVVSWVVALAFMRTNAGRAIQKRF